MRGLTVGATHSDEAGNALVFPWYTTSNSLECWVVPPAARDAVLDEQIRPSDKPGVL